MKEIRKQLPIGVFDSGVGGLTVLRALQEKMPHESFLYLGDTARLPYGTKSPETIIRYVVQANKILVERGIKFLVIACSTASTVSLPALKNSFPNTPTIGMLKPGAQAACAVSQTGTIGVIATEATINGQGYQHAISELRPDATIIAKSCGLFVALAEEGCTEGLIAEEVAKMYLHPLLQEKTAKSMDCLVLGCTHYPALATVIKKVVGDKITIVDSAKITADIVAETLIADSLNNSAASKFAETLIADSLNNSDASKSAETTFFVTDAPERFARIARLFLGRDINQRDIELVDCGDSKE
jgi:glutamate racemase